MSGRACIKCAYLKSSAWKSVGNFRGLVGGWDMSKFKHKEKVTKTLRDQDFF